ncbi:hypothetical protein FH972_022276 [Carpinus fangiana]|uniref:Fe2OG dioxygenase domain-containing protein n=1 Tax=Carpinus fangiana TaxID=176857 RepID=A0A5N6KSA8_9ROSI|nr:hypothetical protein FH972_022276 [Carpinus fangiana]
MPTSEYFKRYPDFPSNIPEADIPTISLAELELGANDEVKLLYTACRRHGFFRLDLRDSDDGRNLLNNAVMMLDVSGETLSLDTKILEQFAYNPPKDLTGYKSAGKLKTDDGKLDAMEMYTLSQDDILSTSGQRTNPEPLDANRGQCYNFFRDASKCVSTVLNALDKSLDLAPGTLASRCPLDKPSDTSLRMLLSHPSTSSDSDRRITLGGHTDIGLITMLFNIVGGLQILPAADENVYDNWRYIKPLPGCAIINLGDTIVEWTGGLLRSALHRVVNPPGQQANVTRQSLAYLVRPAREMTMSRLAGGNSLIPPLPKGEQDDTRSVTEWATSRAMQIMKGELRPRTTGGVGA